jgi:hypothetical protein
LSDDGDSLAEKGVDLPLPRDFPKEAKAYSHTSSLTEVFPNLLLYFNGEVLPHLTNYQNFLTTHVHMEGYCVKCRKKVPMVSPTTKVNSRGVGMWQAKCATCAKTVNTFKSKAPPPPVK